MSNRIYCYHENLGSKYHDEVVDYWKQVWTEHGWEPHVLGLGDAKCHPRYYDVTSKAFSLPTVNNRDFERACFVRWCAFAQVEGVVTDSDVFPRVYYPPRQYSTPYCADPCGGPGFMAGSKDDFERIVEAILSFDVKDADTVFGKPHVSDLTVLQHNTHFRRCHDIACYGVDAWDTRPLTHFANAYLADLPGTKLQRIKRILANEQ